MFTVFMKGDSMRYTTGFSTYAEARYYGTVVFGPNNFEIEREW